jgi:branched-subunit amino acid aminotransferase/4-amino-4-deoxychorismate lyase
MNVCLVIDGGFIMLSSKRTILLTITHDSLVTLIRPRGLLGSGRRASTEEIVEANEQRGRCR